MQLDDAQKQRVGQWIAEGLKLGEIQNRLASEFGLRLTYMEVRLLVDDLKLVPKDPERPKEPALPPPPAPAGTASGTGEPPVHDLDAPEPPPAGGGVSVTVDQLARPGTLLSGKVTFRDGQTADWALDQMGRLALLPVQKGYRPTTEDVREFQQTLQTELARMGF